MKISIVWLISFLREFLTHLIMIQSHVELMFQTLFSLSIRVLPSYYPGLSAYLTSWAWAFEAFVQESLIHKPAWAV
jgi:hypothetical protein